MAINELMLSISLINIVNLRMGDVNYTAAGLLHVSAAVIFAKI